MTRLEAIRFLRAGNALIKQFTPENDGVSMELEVRIYAVDICDFSRHRQPEHESIGPIHLRFWEGRNPDWIHISHKQLLGFIKRNYPRS